MSITEFRHGVWLYSSRIGTLRHRGDYSWFTFDEEYLEKPSRPVLGLSFEDDLSGRWASALRLPPWFSNLLPEGQLRDWIAQERGVSPARELELLLEVGRDLPGAVRVLGEEVVDAPAGAPFEGIGSPSARADSGTGWRFSLAGVGLKFSMLREGDRLTLPAYGSGGDWIVKLPDPQYQNVPLNEATMMTLASRVGILVPEHMLVDRERLGELPPDVWPSGEKSAYAVRRFDRGADRSLIHMEDFAQVRSRYPEQKYEGNFESIAAIAFRGRDVESLQEFTRRLVFNVMVSNGDAHMKNWTLLYPDGRVPTLSPAYDLVSTSPYRPGGVDEDMGLKFRGSRRFETVRLAHFDVLESRLGAAGAGLSDIARDTVDHVSAAWAEVEGLLAPDPELRRAIGRSIGERRASLTRR